MFLKNWDMTRIKLITYSATGKSINEDRESNFRYYNGNYGSFEIKPDSNTENINAYSINDWDTRGYPSSGAESAQFIWPGGDIDGIPARIRPSIERDMVRYEDFDLYSPFIGGSAPGSGQIYGQKHTVTEAVYNSELDQWEKTVTREFKNESGHTITVRELGYYHSQVLMAREILETPIEVDDDSYFKVSFTYKIENPHENRKVKRVKQYSKTFYSDHDDRNNPSDDLILSLNKNYGRVLMIAKWYHTSKPSNLDNYYLDLKGWTGTDVVEPFVCGRSTNSYYFTTRIYILTPKKDEEDNSIRMTNSKVNDGYFNFTYVYLKDAILDIVPASEQKENYFIGLDYTDDTEITLHKEASEKNIIWLAMSNPVHTTPNFYQKDLFVCDYDYVNIYNETSIFFDNTDATEHIIAFSHRNSSNQYYRSYAFLKLRAIMKDDIPLYEDVPVQR